MTSLFWQEQEGQKPQRQEHDKCPPVTGPLGGRSLSFSSILKPVVVCSPPWNRSPASVRVLTVHERKRFRKYEPDRTQRNVRTQSSAFCGPEPTSHNFCSNSSLRRIEQMLSENVDWNRIQKTRSEKLGIKDSS